MDELIVVRGLALEEAARLVELFASEFLSQSENKSLGTAMACLFSEVAGEIRKLQGDSNG
jgi:hypothetical protein